VIKRGRYILVLSAACAGCCSAQIGIINTYAGNDYGSFPGNGGPATNAIITSPSGVATDASGNLYIAATGNSLIRLVNAQTGIITTVAGGGTGGDGGPATSAQLVNPCDVKVDTAGNLYISETCVTNQGGGGSGGTGSGGGGRVRRVDATTGVITTIAGGNTGSLGDGGPATNAMLNTPGGLALDSAGNLFIADFGNNRIRRVDAASGIITTVAGNGSAAFAGDGGPATSASLNGPIGVAVDSSGNVFIADTGNGRIRRVDAGTGNITTIAGTGATVFNGDGIAATTANLYLPAYLAFNSSGNLIFADWLNDRVRMIDNSGIIWTLAGIGNSTSTQIGDNGPASMAVLTRPIGIAVLSSGPLFIAEHGADDRIRRVALPSSVAATAVTVSAGGNSFPHGAPVTLTATLAASNGQPYNATSGVMFFEGSTLLGSGPVANGSVSMTTSSLAQGAHSISAIYPGDSNFGGSYSPVFTLTIVAASTTVTMSTSPNPSSFGQSVTLTATVTPASATGWVQFYNGTTPLGSGMLYNGQAQSTAGALPVGINSLTAVYQGDANNSSATSNAIQQTVNKASTTTTLTSSQNPSASGASVTLTATVTPSSATGSVQFFNGTTLLSTATLSNGQAQFSTTALPIGTDSLTVTYQGDTNYTSSTSGAIQQTVNQASTTTSLTSSPNPSTFGASVTLTATVTPSSATGSVQFFNGTTLLGTATLSSGQAQFSTTALPVGTDSLTATYQGDANNTSSTSGAIQQTVTNPPPTVTLSSTYNPAPVGQPVTFLVSLNPSIATGTVQFLDGSTVLGTATISSGGASFSTSTLSQGTHSITASYSGDSSFPPATSNAVSESVKLLSTLALTLNPNPSAVGQTVTFTVNVFQSAATGTVSFLDGNAVLATVPLNSGVAAFSTSSLSLGNHQITATYNGDANYVSSQSSTTTQAVKLSSSVALGASPNPSTSGQAVTLAASVTPTAATGTVQFFDGATSLGTATLSGGAASLTTSALASGTHSLTAAYSGDANYVSATSPATTQSVLASTSVTLVSSQNPAYSNTPVNFTATVTPAAATGTVQFLDGATVLGTVALSGGSAVLTTSALNQGSHSITAVYSGDANDSGCTSAALSQVMKSSAGMTTGISPSPAVAGQTVTLAANVNSAATGTVQFLDGSTVLATVNVVSGAASYATSTLARGSHPIGFNYSGDANYMSQSTTFTLTVLGTTTTALASSPNPSTLGQSATFTAAVTPSTSTGTVQFYDGSTSLGTGTLTSGSATFTTSALSQGSHSITANYSGDANNAGSSSPAIQQTVNKTSTTTSLASSPNPSTVGASVTLTATVTPTSATGTVQFFNGSTLLGSASLSSGRAQLTTAALPVGISSLTAAYGGDSNYAASTSGAIQQTVNKLSTTTGLTSSPNPSTVGASVTLTATVTPAAATGSVQFFDGSTLLGSANLSSGQGQLTTTALPPGTNSLTATYAGDANDAASSSSATLQTVNKLSTTTSLTSSPNPSTFGGPVTLTATVAPSSATGSVQFFNGGTLLGSANLSSGQAQFTTTALPAGTDSLTASYAGDANNAASVSSARLQTVNKVNSSTTLTASPSSSNVGQTVTFTATVTPAAATGTVKFMNGGSQMGTATLSNGTAVFSTSSLTSGSHSIKAVYQGDSNVNSSQSSTLNYHVH
jgi:sugar lactone lactonase YvrE